MTSKDLSRYDRQMRFAELGKDAQQKLLDSTALICGCGALGSVIANTLARAGVGHLRIVDRDFLELNNLQRQVIYDEQDVEAGLPKAIAAANRLRRVNSTIEIEPIVADVDQTNVRSLCDGVQCIVDGTDNFETRFLLNDASRQLNIPWVYGGCIGAEGQTMTVVPGVTPCLRCLMPEPPPAGSAATCDTAGILGPIVNVIASVEACEAIKILSGNVEAVSRKLSVFELWENRFRQVGLSSLLESNTCPTCNGQEFPWLEGERGSHSAVLCGRNSVQLSFPERTAISLDSLAQKLEGLGAVVSNDFLLRFSVDDYVITVFPDGRAIVGGTDDVPTARTLYSKYIGS